MRIFIGEKYFLPYIIISEFSLSVIFLVIKKKSESLILHRKFSV